MARRTRRNQRGIVLLIVLSMLVIFSLLVTTFIVVSGQYRTAAIMSARNRAKRSDPPQLMENVVHTMIVDTNDPQSPLRGQGILRDMYGDDGFTARVAPPGALPLATTNNQFFELRLSNPAAANATFQRDIPRDLSGRPYALSGIGGYYNGLVLTFVDGPAKGVSTRIMGYDPVGPPGNPGNVFRLMVVDPTTASVPQAGDRVVINGRPFSGTGFGFNPLDPISTLNAPDPGPDGKWGVAGVDDDGQNGIDDIGEALSGDDLPTAALLTNQSSHVDAPDAMANYLRGGADERYDAADFQNLHLAALIPAYNQYEMILQEANSPPQPPYDYTQLNRNLVLPSYHRPLLINWWLRNVIAPAVAAPTERDLLSVFLQPYGPDNIRNSGDEAGFVSAETLDFVVNLKQKIIARPLPELNPNFTGGNPAFDRNYLAAVASDPTLDFRNPYLMGPWDVDNDGDGEADGIWMDVGLPIEEDEKGRLFKGLVSILCVDLDGRLNLNAQGSQGHLFAFDQVRFPNRVAHPNNLARGASPATLVPGRHEGPADVNLRPLFDLLDPDPRHLANPNANVPRTVIQWNAIWDNYVRLMGGANLPGIARPVPGRYGFDQVPGVPGFDFFSSIKHYEYPENYFNRFTGLGLSGHMSAFQTPPDLFGEIMVGLDPLGQPTYSLQAADPSIPATYRFLNRDHPYEKNLLKPSAADSLYTVAELEELLRLYDPDMNPAGRPIPERLTVMFQNGAPLSNNLFTDSFFAPLARQSVTTHSFDLPVPNIQEPPDLAAIKPLNADLSRLYSVLKPHANTAGLAAPGFSQNDNHRLHHVTEILRARLIQGFGWGGDANSPITPTALNVLNSWNQTSAPHDLRLNRLMTSMVSPDLGMGLRMDLNRPFGNGRDSNNNFIVDEHGFHVPAINPATPGNNSLFRFTLEACMSVDGWDNNGDGTPDDVDEVETFWGGNGFDHDNDGRVVNERDAFFARQHYARHLYLLAMMLKDPNFKVAQDLNGDGLAGPADVENLDTARAVAQWVANIVDFRDADAIMTPFEYDPTPFTPRPGLDGLWGTSNDDDGINGANDIGEAMWPGSDDIAPWAVDGRLGPNPGPDGNFNTGDEYDDANLLTRSDRDVVWGCERPELLMTETLAFHDRRATDENDQGNGRVTDMNGEGDANGDPTAPVNDFDQKLKPRGAFYVELYNPWTSNAERPPAEFYHTHTTSAAGWHRGIAPGWAPGVLLHKVNGGGSPVWRMTVTTADDDTTTFPTPDPDHPAANVTTERVIYFTTSATTQFPAVRPGSPTSAFPHFCEIPSTVGLAPIPPGRYAVVGTRNQFDHGDLVDPESMSSDGQINGAHNEFYVKVGQHSSLGPTDVDSTRRIVLHAHPNPDENWVYVQDNPTDTTLPNRYQPNVAAGTAPNDDIADIMPPVAIPVTNMNISEGRIEWDGTMATKWIPPSPDIPQTDEYDPTNWKDMPFDVDPGKSMDPDPANSDPANPITDVLAENGTYEAIRFVHLQRLANPLLPFDPVYNPYRTIDTMPVDLTVFNGAVSASQQSQDNSVTSGNYVFDSRERGTGPKTPVAGQPLHRNLLDNATTGPQPAAAGVPVASHFFNEPLTHSLGYLNRTYGPARYRWNFTGSGLASNVPNNDMSYIGAPNSNDPLSDPQGDGGQPFPWLTWLNRPFASQYDLMLVPSAQSSQLFTRFSLTEPDEPTDPDPTESVYTPGAAPNFQHLLNFFSMSQLKTPGGGANLASILDFTHVPSKFVGTETWLDPSHFEFNSPGTEFLHPPFNKVSAYRDPGKTNLNTINNHIVMDSIRGGSLPGGLGPAYWQIVDSIRGFGERPVSGMVPPEKLAATPPSNTWIPPGTKVPEMRPFDSTGASRPFYDPVVAASPTIFGNPFRGFGDATLVPDHRWLRPPTEGTLLRSDRFDVADPNVTAAWPIIHTRTPGDPDGDLPLFTRRMGPQPGPQYPQPAATHTDPVRNPYFQYEPIRRLANLTTTRSNVYAVWITIGFFEVEQIPPLVYPNAGPNTGYLNRFGYQLNNELGWDTGDIRRHRSFYVIDRSIPVAFEPGKVHNAEKAIVLRRFIE